MVYSRVYSNDIITHVYMYYNILDIRIYTIIIIIMIAHNI